MHAVAVKSPSDRQQDESSGASSDQALPIPDDALQAVREMTERLFPAGPVELEEMSDPGFPTDRFFVFSVACPLSVDQVVDEQCRWHAELRRIVPTALNSIRLSIRD